MMIYHTLSQGNEVSMNIPKKVDKNLPGQEES